MRARRESIFFAGALVFATGCSGQVVATADANSSTTEALLTVESAAPADGSSLARAHASARFVRMQAGGDDTLATRLVGAALALPALDRCEPVEGLQEPGMPLASLGPIDLIDAGEVTVEAGSNRSALVTRAFPDVVDLISGVVYTTRDAADPLPAPAAYTFHVTGSAQLAPVDIDAIAPPPPQDVRIDGLALANDGATMPRGDLVVAWGPGAADDVVYVDLTSVDGATHTRCTFLDNGAATVPADALPASGTMTVSIHRVHRQTLSATGLDGGEVRFDLATFGTLTLAAPAASSGL